MGKLSKKANDRVNSWVGEVLNHRSKQVRQWSDVHA
jgi:hypothetical protein